MTTDTKLHPQEAVSLKNVLVPTLTSRLMVSEGKTTPFIFVHWFGESHNQNLPIPEEIQFFFNTGISPEHCLWMRNPNSFKVVFIGQIKNWINPNTVNQLLETKGWTPDTTIGWLMSAKSFKPGQPSSPAVQITPLGDSKGGLIAPKPYYDSSVKDQIMQEVKTEMSLLKIGNPETEED